jgi:outer membrane protein
MRIVRLVPLAAALLAAPAAGQEPAPLLLRDVVAATLARSPDIALGELDVRAQEGAVLQARAPYDPRAGASWSRDRTRVPLLGGGESDPSSSLENTLGYQVGVDWQLRWGLLLSPSLGFDRNEASTAPGVVQNTGVAALGMSYPLLRGRGGGATAASLQASTLGLEASRADLGQVRAASVLEAVNAYWGYVAATDALAVQREAEERARTLVERTRTLIAADERPAVDSISVLANAASRASARLNAENAVSQARLALALAMGLPASELRALPARTQAFPAIPGEAEVAAWPREQAWVAYALRQRPDVAAAGLRRGAAGFALRGARSEARPRLDLQGTVAYTGIGVGSEAHRYLSPFSSERQGLQLQLGMAYDLPVGNHAVRGQLARSAAADARAAVVAGELERSLSLSVATAGETLRRTVEAARLSERAVLLFSAAVEGEMMKYQLGTATLFDVLQAEDNRTSARLGWIEAQRRYAAALAQLRFETGSLAPPAAGTCPAAAPAPLTPADGGCPR